MGSRFSAWIIFLWTKKGVTLPMITSRTFFFIKTSRNCSQLNSAEHLSWWVKISSGNGLVPSGNKPLPEPMLTHIYVAIWCHNELIFTFNSTPPSAAYVSTIWVSIVSGNGLPPLQCQAITWTNTDLLWMRPLGTNFSEIWIEIQKFSFTKMHLKMSSAKWRPFLITHFAVNLSDW